MRIASIVGIIACFAAGLWTQSARATFHVWQINQVYSNAAGSVQYVDFVLPFAIDDERLVGGHAISAGLNSNSLILDSNLPAMPVAGQHFLVATPDFSALAGIAPDYTLTPAPFFDPSGDTLNWASVDFFTFPALPSDGILALNRDGSTAINSPTNFAGQIGFVPEPASWVPWLLGIAVLGEVARRARRRRPAREESLRPSARGKVPD
jgi:PEP-CTERM motif